MNIMMLFILCTAVNVILSTIKSILTVRGNKWTAASMNAICYGFYSYIIILTNVDGISTIGKMIITAICNFVGVFIVKLIEEKMRKDKLWEIRATVYQPYTESLHHDLEKRRIPHNFITDVGKYTIFNIYCETQTESALAKELLTTNKAKYFVSESKIL